jgi:hypothetical protein
MVTAVANARTPLPKQKKEEVYYPYYETIANYIYLQAQA